MSNVKHAAPEGQEPALSALRWAESEAARAWLLGLREVIEDARAATEDQLLPLRQRRLGHVEAERITRESFTTIAKALSFAERGLPPNSPAL
jgi:hypothetical protein